MAIKENEREFHSGRWFSNLPFVKETLERPGTQHKNPLKMALFLVCPVITDHNTLTTSNGILQFFWNGIYK